MPEAHWQTAHSSELINQASLDMLDSAAEYLSELDGNDVRPDVGELAELREQTEDWLERVANAGLARGLTASIIDNLNNVIWLIDNFEHFGSAPIVAASERVTGSLLRVAPVAPRPREWLNGVAKFTAAIAVLAGGLTQTNTMIDQTQHLTDEVLSIVQGDFDPDDAPPSERQGGAVDSSEETG